MTQHAGMADAAARLGMKVYWNGPRGGDDTQQQIELVERAIEKKDAGIVVTPTAAFALDTVIQRALSDGIPLVILGSEIPFPSNPGLTFVVNDVDESAAMAAGRVCSIIGRAEEIAVIGIEPGTPGVSKLVSGFERNLRQCSRPVRIVSKVRGTVTLGQSEMTVTRILTENPKLKVIFSLSSIGTRGAVLAAASLHRSSSVQIISTDPTHGLVQLLRQGMIDSLVFPNMREMGEKAVENIVRERQQLPVQPVTLFPPVLVTRENVDTKPVQTLLRMDWRELQ